MSQERKFFNLQNKNEIARSAAPTIPLSPEVTQSHTRVNVASVKQDHMGC